MKKTDSLQKTDSFEKNMLKIALPVTLQTLLQSSFSVIDQVMIGQLGSGSIAGIGLGGKFASLYSVVLASVTSAAGIMIAQYMGRKDKTSVSRSFYINLSLSLGIAAFFLILCTLFPEAIMTAYTRDEATKALAAAYIRIFALSFLPMAVGSMAATALRCMEAAAFPLYAGIISLAANTGLNYLLIFGKWGFPGLGVKGAAYASAAAQLLFCIAVLLFFFYQNKNNPELYISWPGKYYFSAKKNILSAKHTISTESAVSAKHTESAVSAKHTESAVSAKHTEPAVPTEFRNQYFKILCPLLSCEFLWSLGENIYTAIYGNIGTDACAAMTMTIPVQTIVIGALSGLSQASGVLIGKSLGAKKYRQAYDNSKKLLKYGFAVSLALSLLLVFIRPLYVDIYHATPNVQEITENLLGAIALVAPIKVINMILGGGILRSGGKTHYIMWIDIIGTWVFGVPLGLWAAFVCNFPITYVYLILSLEECIRCLISLVVFQKKIWMESIK